MTYLLYPRHRATFTLALAIVLISHTLNATSGTYTEGIYGLNNEVAQDTVFLEYEEFIDRALEQIGQLQAAQVSVSLAQNQVQQVRNQRFLPSLRMESEHGILPSVISPRGFPNNQIYLDPDATYDWDNWDFANRFRVIGVQPLFIWGAVDKAVKAAQFGVQSIEQQATATKQEIELQLHGLYFGYQLALEIERLLDVAIETMNTVER
jgi:outer membrane protein TolC